MISLKSIPGAFQEQKFALLIKPDLSGISNDEELYQQVFQAGTVIIGHLGLNGQVGPAEEMSADRFFQDWQGD
jgi:hypothetical protein